MIISKEGKSFSVRTPEEEEEMLQGEIDRLSPEERQALTLMLEEMRQKDPEDKTVGIYGAMRAAEFKREMVDMETFVRDPYYLGHTCDVIFPKLLDDLKELFTGDYHEAIFTGSIGVGKTFTASIGVCRILYELSCMKDPHRSYRLAPDSNIAVVAISVNELLAVKVAFENIASKIKASPYFQEHFPFEPTKKELRFPGNIWVAARASTDTSALGLNPISAILDETNFMPRSARNKRSGGVDPLQHYDHAEVLYNAIKRRMKSRFQTQGVKLPGMLFVVSSKNTRDDFTSRRIKESINDPHVFCSDRALWEAKPEGTYCDEVFHVVAGNETTPSRILEEHEDPEEVEGQLPEDVVLIRVPADFRIDFERDMEGAIRDIAGVSTVAISPYIQRREKIVEAVDTREHPFSVLEYDPSKGGEFLWDKLIERVRERDYNGIDVTKLRPLRNPTAARHVHIDPSQRNDATGFCMSHIGGFKGVVRRSEDGQQYTENAPVYIVDIILRIVPPIGGEIVLGDVRRLVYDLSAHGFTITSVSIDSWQSVDSIQQLAAKGYNSQLLSVDKKIDPYDNLKTALYEGRVYYYEYPRLLKELREVEHDRVANKVDHPAKGSKDLADSLAGCLYTLSQQRVYQPLPIMRGVSYHGDEWVEENMLPKLHQAEIPNDSGEKSADNFGMLPPFLTGTGTDGWDGDGSNWM